MALTLTETALPSGIAATIVELETGDRFTSWQGRRIHLTADREPYRFYAVRIEGRSAGFFSLTHDIDDALQLDELDEEQIAGPFFHPDGELLYWESAFVVESWRGAGVFSVIAEYIRSLDQPVFVYFENDPLQSYCETHYATAGPSLTERLDREEALERSQLAAFVERQTATL